MKLFMPLILCICTITGVLSYEVNEPDLDIIINLFENSAQNIPDVLIRRRCVNARYTYTGKTWLHYCSELGFFACVKKLLQNGAYFNIKDNYERTPYENSQLYYYPNITALLKEAKLNNDTGCMKFTEFCYFNTLDWKQVSAEAFNKAYDEIGTRLKKRDPFSGNVLRNMFVEKHLDLGTTMYDSFYIARQLNRHFERSLFWSSITYLLEKDKPEN